MKTKKVDFSKLVGNNYSLEFKMTILDWMLSTGKGIEHRYGWNVDGVNKSLLNYSANNNDTPVCLPRGDGDYSLFFDAIFARAVYKSPNKALEEWRIKESIHPEKYRMLKFNDTIPDCTQEYLSGIIRDILELEDKFLKKEFHHPEYLERTYPKIIWISIYTKGNGWIVQYEFSFKEYNYAPGWTNGFIQDKNESIWEFMKRSYDELINNLIK